MWKLPDSASVRQEFAESAKFNSLADTGETVSDSVRSQSGDDERRDRETDWLDNSF